MHNIFCSKNLAYRPVTLEDEDLILSWRNSESVKKNFVIQEPITKEDNHNWYHECLEKGKAVQFIVSIKDEQLEIGSVYLKNIDAQKKDAEFGIFIGVVEQRGKLYGKEITQWALKYAKEHLNLSRVYLKVFANNIEAIKVYKNCGFKLIDKTLNVDHNGGYCDLLHMEHVFK